MVEKRKTHPPAIGTKEEFLLKLYTDLDGMLQLAQMPVLSGARA